MVELLTERLKFIPFEGDMIDDLLRLHGDADVMQHMRGGVETPGQTRQTLHEYLQSWTVHGISMWALYDVASGDFVGECGFRYHEVVGGMALRFGLMKSFWGRGLAQHSVGRAIDYAFAETAMAHVHSIAMDVNTRSCQVMEQFGFELMATGVRDTPGLRLYRLAKSDYLQSCQAS